MPKTYSFSNFILKGKAHGPIASALMECDFDPGMYQPYFNERGIPCVDLRTGKKIPKKNAKGEPVLNRQGGQILVPEVEVVRIRDLDHPLPVHNATTLRKDEWRVLQDAVVEAARPRLRAWADASSRVGTTMDAWSTLILEHETINDNGEARVDMDMLNEERNYDPEFQLQGTPMPITHSGFWLSKRLLAVSRRMGTGLDVVKAERAGRRIAEKIEKTLIGTIAGIQFGTAANYTITPKVYGYTNYPGRITKTNMNAPTGSNGTTILGDWLALRDLLYQQNKFGPFMVYTSTDYDTYLDNLFSTTEPSAGTLRSRLLQIDGIEGIRRLDYLTNTFTVLFVEMNKNTVEAINGMPINTVQWEEMGGFLLKFRTLTIQVPRIREDQLGQCGIAHGTTA